MKTLKIALIVVAFFMCKSVLSQSCDVISDNYSNATLWTYVSSFSNSKIKINSGTLKFINSIDSKEERLYRKFTNMINSKDDWIMNLEFTPTSAGLNNNSGHIIIGITAGNKDPLAICLNSVDCSKTGKNKIKME